MHDLTPALDDELRRFQADLKGMPGGIKYQSQAGYQVASAQLRRASDPWSTRRTTAGRASHDCRRAEWLCLAAPQWRKPNAWAIHEILVCHLREVLFGLFDPALRRLCRRVSLDMPEQRFPRCSLRASPVAQIAPHHVAPAARWVERIVLIVPQQHMDVRNRVAAGSFVSGAALAALVILVLVH